MKKHRLAPFRFWRIHFALWVITAVVLGIFAAQLPSKLEGDGFRTDGAFETVQETLHGTFGFPEQTLLVLFEREPNEPEPVFQARIRSVLEKIEEKAAPSAIDSPLENSELREETLAYASIHFNKESDQIDALIDDVRAITGQAQNVSLTGGPVINKDINQASQDDLKQAELIGLPVALVVLLLALETAVASVLPLLIGGMTIVIAFGLLSFLADSVDLAIFILNIVPMLGLALSIDFCLLFINRYKEERNNGFSLDEALQITIRKAGHSILFSALCVFIGLGSVLLIDIDIFKNVAIGGMTVVTIAVATSLTLLPALLKGLGDRVYKWKLIRTKRDTTNRWRAFAGLVMKKPALVASLALIILVTAMIPIRQMVISIPEVDSLPDSYESKTAYETIEAAFWAESPSTVYAVAERPGGWLNQSGFAVMQTFQDQFEENQHVSEVDTLLSAGSPGQLAALFASGQVPAELQAAADALVQGNQLLIPVALDVEAGSDEAQDIIRSWNKQPWPADVSFGGRPAFNQEIYDKMWAGVLPALSVILISTFFILMIAFRSVLIPLKAILMNIASLSATFGILVWLFQGGHFGLEPSDISLILPVLVFSLVFGLSMDYEVFLISRIREFYLDTGDNTYATVEGLASTSKIITSAALIMIAITGAFAFTDVVPVKQIGIGIAIAIAIDATIVRLLLVPSLMKLLGSANWWMPFKR